MNHAGGLELKDDVPLSSVFRARDPKLIMLNRPPYDGKYEIRETMSSPVKLQIEGSNAITHWDKADHRRTYPITWDKDDGRKCHFGAYWLQFQSDYCFDGFFGDGATEDDYIRGEFKGG